MLLWALQCPFPAGNQRAWEPVDEVRMDQFPGVQSRKRRTGCRSGGANRESRLMMKMVTKMVIRV